MTALDCLTAYELGAIPSRSTQERADGVSLVPRLVEAARSTLALVGFLLIALAPMLLAGAIGYFGNGS